MMVKTLKANSSKLVSVSESHLLESHVRTYVALNRGVRGSLHLQPHISLSVCAILIVEQRKRESGVTLILPKSY